MRAGEEGIILGRTDPVLMSRMPVIHNCTDAASTDDMNAVILSFMSSASKNILVPHKNVEKTPNHTAAALTESTNAVVDSLRKASRKGM
jgi:hypothetical protein